MQKTADHLGLTKQRVSQLLNKGKKYKLYTYELARKRNLKNLAEKIGRENLIREIKNEIIIPKICKKLGIDIVDFHKLIKHFELDYQDYNLSARQRRYIRMYMNIVDELGHHPSTTEMNTRTKWRGVWSGLSRHWNSMEKFRREFGIEQPPRFIHPNTIVGFREHKIKVKQKKATNIDKIRELLQNYSIPVNIEMIASNFTCARGTINNYLTTLISTGEIIKIREGKRVKYTLKKTHINSSI